MDLQLHNPEKQGSPREISAAQSENGERMVKEKFRNNSKVLRATIANKFIPL